MAGSYDDSQEHDGQPELDADNSPHLKYQVGRDSCDESCLIGVPSNNSLTVVSANVSVSDAEGDESREPLLPLPAAPAVPKDNVPLGMLYYGCSSFFFAAMGICSKLLGHYEYPVWEITLWRAVIILGCCMSMLLSAGDNPLGNRRGLLLVRGTLGYGSITCYFFACQNIPIADATTFTFLGPLVVALLSPVVLKEKISAATAVVIPLCFSGVLLITQPNFLFGRQSAQLSVLGLVFGLAQPLFSATAKMTVRLLRTTEKTNVMVFYLMMCTLLYSIIGCAADYKRLVMPRSWPEYALLLAQGLAGYGNQVCITLGLKKAKAASVMCMQYFSIVISQLAGMLIFSEFTTWVSDIGMGMVVASMAVYLWWEARNKNK